MIRTAFILPVLLLGLVLPVKAQDQRVTEFGLTGGPVRFYPQAGHPEAGWAASMDNGWGWSMGIFVEDHRFLRFHPVVELNHYTLSTDVNFQSTSAGQNGNGAGEKANERNFSSISFNHLGFSGGIKYFIIPELVVYPAIEVARTLNPDVEKNRYTLRMKLAAGVNLGYLDVMLEYAYGLYRQQIAYYDTDPYVSNHRNTFLQLKLQVPLYKIGRIPPDWKGDRYLKSSR